LKRNRWVAVGIVGLVSILAACGNSGTNGYTIKPYADLTKANLTNADLINANLLGADLSDADLRGVDLTNANLINADLINANLRGADLRDANLRGVDLTNANLTNASLRGANLRGADLSDANLTGTALRDIKWNSDTIWPEGFAPPVTTTTTVYIPTTTTTVYIPPTTTVYIPPPTTAAPVPVWSKWYPQGYTPVDGVIAWRWMNSSEFKCDFSGAKCWGVEVVARYGCSSVYVTVSAEDQAGRVIGTAIDSLGAIGAGQHGVLKPSGAPTNSVQGSIDQVSCFS